MSSMKIHKSKLLDEDITKITPKSEMNGAGPKGWGWLIPDQLGLVNIARSANIHDAQYYWIRKLNSKDPNKIPHDKLKYITRGKSYADKIFYKNLKILNKHKSPTFIGFLLRKPILFLYYISVRLFGKV